MRRRRKLQICFALAIIPYVVAVWIGVASGADWHERISLSVLLSIYATMFASIPFGITFGSQDKFWT